MRREKGIKKAQSRKRKNTVFPREEGDFKEVRLFAGELQYFSCTTQETAYFCCSILRAGLLLHA